MRPAATAAISATSDIAKILALVFILALASTLASTSALAVGVSPSQQEIAFASGVHQDMTLRVLNMPAKDMKAVIYARGELAEYITFTETLVSLSADEEMKTITYSIDMPKELEKPGLHEAEIIVMEYPKEFGEANTGNTVKVVGAVVSKLYVRVPYPSKYAEGEAAISSGNIGEDIAFTVSLFNFGKEDIKSAKALIEIFGPTYEKLGTIQTAETSLLMSQSGKVVGKWKANVNPGTYHAIITVTYDENRFIIEKNFDIGNMYVDATGIDVQNFRLGMVAKMDILLENRWNSEIKDVYGDVTVKDDSKVYTTFKTASTDVPALGKSKIISYWDTTDVAPGKYTALVKLAYAGKTTEKSFDLNVNLDSIKTVDSLTGNVASAQSKPISGNTLIMLLVVVLIAANIGWFVFFNKRLKKK
jgi:hypothetical protein